MSVKRATLLLLLLAAVGTNAAPGPEDCDGLNITVPAKDLHKVIGDWVLVWSVFKSEIFPVDKLNISRVKLHFLADNSGISLLERNVFLNGLCTTYGVNMTIPSDSHKLRVEHAMEETDGVVQYVNESFTAEFFENCDDCLVMSYRGEEEEFLFIYKREGHHLDIEKMKESHDDYKKLAVCLGLSLDREFIFKGAADFCQKKSSPEAGTEAGTEASAEAGPEAGAEAMPEQ